MTEIYNEGTLGNGTGGSYSGGGGGYWGGGNTCSSGGGGSGYIGGVTGTSIYKKETRKGVNNGFGFAKITKLSFHNTVICESESKFFTLFVLIMI